MAAAMATLTMSMHISRKTSPVRFSLTTSMRSENRGAENRVANVEAPKSDVKADAFLSSSSGVASWGSSTQESGSRQNRPPRSKAKKASAVGVGALTKMGASRLLKATMLALSLQPLLPSTASAATPALGSRTVLQPSTRHEGGQSPLSTWLTAQTAVAHRAQTPVEVNEAPKEPSSSWVVTKGQTLSSIAAETGTTVAHLLRLNPHIQDPDLIFVGETLRLVSESIEAPTPSLTRALWVPADASEAAMVQALSEVLPTDVEERLRDISQGTPLYEQVAHDGQTLLQHMHAIRTQPLAADFGAHQIDSDVLVRNVAREVTDPGRNISQDNYNTCTVTSMQYLLALHRPAEYARAISELSSPKGEFHAVGAKIRRDKNSVGADKSNRTVTERVFQSAMMEFANGSRADYDPSADKNRLRPHGKVPAGGSWSGQLTWGEIKGLKALFGKVDTESVFEFWELNSRKDVLRHLTPDTHGRAMLAMRWGKGGHAVAFERIEDNRLYYRNPWGAQWWRANGQDINSNGPPRRMEDASRGIESIHLDVAKKILLEAFVVPTR